jgi:hypothetical protein
VITNERQYRITKAEVKKFERALADAEAAQPSTDLHPRLQRAMRDGLASQLHDLRREIEAFEALRGGRVRMLQLDSLDQLPDMLISGRIAAGVSQAALARRLGVAKQQVQRDEAARYATATFSRMVSVAHALGITVRSQVLLPIESVSASDAADPADTTRR